MRPEGSYDPQRESPDMEAEVRRLEQQVAISWTQELRLLRTVGMCDGLDVLEVGCGPGFFAERMLRSFPAMHVTAIDAREDFADLARLRLAAAAPGRARVLASSIMECGLGEGQFDFAVARLVFQHLADPVAAAHEIRRRLRPSGVLAVIDVDMGLWGLVHPRIEGLESIYAQAGRLQAEGGGDRLIARRLWRILQEASFTDVQLDAYAYHSDDLGIEAFGHQLEPDRLLSAVAAGSVRAGDHARAKLGYETFRHHPDAFVLLLGFIASGRRPPQG